jgi:hypothetical protein
MKREMMGDGEGDGGREEEELTWPPARLAWRRRGNGERVGRGEEGVERRRESLPGKLRRVGEGRRAISRAHMVFSFNEVPVEDHVDSENIRSIKQSCMLHAIIS